MNRLGIGRRGGLAVICVSLVFAIMVGGPSRLTFAAAPPVPLLELGHPVSWWFVFKLSTKTFPGCGGDAVRVCLFGGAVQDYSFGQQFVYASSENPSLQQGRGCAGDTVHDPVGATFGEIYNGAYFYVVWNDQFYEDPPIDHCSGDACGAPWGHSKGMLAWNENGEGLVLQVTTPSWPASGSRATPRKEDGNTLGCVEDDNVKVSQHFLALKLTPPDLLKVLAALVNASIVTDTDNPQVVRNGGPTEVQELVHQLGTISKSTEVTKVQLSMGVGLISKPSALHVPPWQMVSAILDMAPLRTATWWANPKIYTTTGETEVTCWSAQLHRPAAVEIALRGRWAGKEFGLTGGGGPDFNHAKIGITIGEDRHLAIFGDMNQQGAISGDSRNCGRSQNGRGGLFYVIDDPTLHGGLKDLLAGPTAPAGKAP